MGHRLLVRLRALRGPSQGSGLRVDGVVYWASPTDCEPPSNGCAQNIDSVPRGEQMLYAGTDPESNVTESTSLYEDKILCTNHSNVLGGRVQEEAFRNCTAIPSQLCASLLNPRLSRSVSSFGFRILCSDFRIKGFVFRL